MLLAEGCTKKYLEVKMTNTFDKNTYSDLLTQIAPRLIETEEYDRLLVITERLTFAKNSTPEERAL